MDLSLKIVSDVSFHSYSDHRQPKGQQNFLHNAQKPGNFLANVSRWLGSKKMPYPHYFIQQKLLILSNAMQCLRARGKCFVNVSKAENFDSLMPCIFIKQTMSKGPT